MVLAKCECSTKFLENLQLTTGDADRNSDFIQRKQDRELRRKKDKYMFKSSSSIFNTCLLVLHNKWTHLGKSVRKDEKSKSVYCSLKEDISNLEAELKQIQSKIDTAEKKKKAPVKSHIRFYKDCRIKLSRMKPRLFDLNLTVHNLLGEVSQEDVEVGGDMGD